MVCLIFAIAMVRSERVKGVFWVQMVSDIPLCSKYDFIQILCQNNSATVEICNITVRNVKLFLFIIKLIGKNQTMESHCTNF